MTVTDVFILARLKQMLNHDLFSSTWGNMYYIIRSLLDNYLSQRLKSCYLLSVRRVGRPPTRNCKAVGKQLYLQQKKYCSYPECQKIAVTSNDLIQVNTTSDLAVRVQCNKETKLYNFYTIAKWCWLLGSFEIELLYALHIHTKRTL